MSFQRITQQGGNGLWDPSGKSNRSLPKCVFRCLVCNSHVEQPSNLPILCPTGPACSGQQKFEPPQIVKVCPASLSKNTPAKPIVLMNFGMEERYLSIADFGSNSRSISPRNWWTNFPHLQVYDVFDAGTHTNLVVLLMK